MKTTMQPHVGISQERAFTLLELLLTIAIIGLLISLLLPSLERGQVRVKAVQCKNNLHQLGLGMLSFAHGHEDKFPVQVSTNQGGSLEFIDAGNAVNGEFYFAYKHFLPLAAEIETPKMLLCPADHRAAATNFSSLRNTNLSYFVAADPQYGGSESILSGDRNLTPASNSIARLRRAQPLKWTAEMHEYKGNVLFADGHVETLNNVVSQTASAGRPYANLVMPSTPPLAAIGPVDSQPGVFAGSPGAAVQGGNLKVSFGSNANLGGLTNVVLTNLTIESGPPRLPPWPFTTPGPGGDSRPPPMPSLTRTQQNGASVASAIPEKSEEEDLQAAHQDLVNRGRDLSSQAVHRTYWLPWWLIVLLLLGCLRLLHRARSHYLSSRAQEPHGAFHPGKKEAPH